MEIALRFGGEIISVDSMQVYRGLDIGTAKPSRADLARVPHNLIDCVDVGFDFSVADFQMAGRAIIERLDLEGKPAVICGGSGLHFRALVDPLEFPPTDPVVRNALVVMEIFLVLVMMNLALSKLICHGQFLFCQSQFCQLHQQKKVGSYNEA